MKKNANLLASVALFSELYDSKKDIYDVIAEFLKAAIIAESKWSFNSTEATQLLEELFDFKIPEAVVKQTLKNRLKKENLVSVENGLYTFLSEEEKNNKLVSKEFENLKDSHEQIFSKLCDFIEKSISKKLTEKDKEELGDNFHSFLLEKPVPDKHSQYISSFIIEHSNDSIFKEKLNAIKEGLVLYTGIRFTADLNDLGSWNYDFTIFLDTEHLFSSVGYNGLLYEQVYNDFFKLVKEINSNSVNKTGKKKIELKYFEEIKLEIDNFFSVAERILEGKARLDPSKTAMISILNGCRTPSEIIEKKARFYDELKSKGIHIENKIDYYRDHSYVVEGTRVIEKLKKEAHDNGRILNTEECIHYLKLFTKINVLRKGISNIGFDRSSCVLVTANRLAQHLAFDPNVKMDEKDTPFATSIDFVTDRFWFKLKKGFSDRNALPKSFDIITKAQIVMSSQVNSSISKKFQELSKKVENGQFTQEQALSTYLEFREMNLKPEEFTTEVMSDALAFLNDENLERHLREKSLLIKQAREGEEAKRKLKQINIKALRQKKFTFKILSKLIYWSLLISTAILALSLTLILWFYIKDLKTPDDTAIGLIGFFLTIMVEVIGVVKFINPLHKWIKRVSYRYYLNKVKKLSYQNEL